MAVQETAKEWPTPAVGTSPGIAEFLSDHEAEADVPGTDKKTEIARHSHTVPIEDVIAALASPVPDEAWECLPDDLSSSRTLDSYLYGIES